ncbi:unnamed protein product [Rotaria sordida]|uniref:Uncharacterized protein n=1 Tax=Rotaria sordida TaxID=392033 RepID=A0A814JH48_9BILA|nr:unnamed protein product [Rotaria sordida]
MAIENDLPSVKPPSTVFVSSSSSSTSSSLSPFIRQGRLVQVGTNNSAAFIQFPTNARQSSPFVPISSPRTSHSLTRQSSSTVDTQSLSNQSKSSTHATTASIASGDHKRGHFEQRINPILNNPFLNHRKEQQKYPPIKSSNEHCLSSKLLSNNTQISTNCASTVLPIVHQQETNINLSDRLIILNDNKTREQQMQYVNENKYDYITRWLNAVRAATYSNETIRSESKRTKRRVLSS